MVEVDEYAQLNLRAKALLISNFREEPQDEGKMPFLYTSATEGTSMECLYSTNELD